MVVSSVAAVAVVVYLAEVGKLVLLFENSILFSIEFSISNFYGAAVA